MSLPYAGLWIRIKSFAADYLLISLYLVGITLACAGINTLLPDLFRYLFSDRLLSQLSGFLLITLPVTLYFAIGESSARGATWGKARLGLAVRAGQGETLSFSRALVRTGIKFLPWELAHTCVWQIHFTGDMTPAVIIGLVLVWVMVLGNALAIGLSTKKQAIYDIIADTYVVYPAKLMAGTK